MKHENKWFTVASGGTQEYRDNHERIFGPKYGKWNRSKLRDLLVRYSLPEQKNVDLDFLIKTMMYQKEPDEIRILLENIYGNLSLKHEKFMELASEIWDGI